MKFEPGDLLIFRSKKLDIILFKSYRSPPDIKFVGIPSMKDFYNYKVDENPPWHDNGDFTLLTSVFRDSF